MHPSVPKSQATSLVESCSREVPPCDKLFERLREAWSSRASDEDERTFASTSVRGIHVSSRLSSSLADSQYDSISNIGTNGRRLLRLQCPCQCPVTPGGTRNPVACDREGRPRLVPADRKTSSTTGSPISCQSRGRSAHQCALLVFRVEGELH